MDAAGLALGIIPVGLKIYKEIDSFIDSVKHAESETASLAQHVYLGRTLLDFLTEALRNNQPVHRTIEVTITNAFHNLRRELESANKVVAKLRGSKDLTTLENAVATKPTLAPLGKAKKYTFYWRRDKLKALEQHLSYCNSHLQTILQVYSIVKSQDAREEIQYHFSELKSELKLLQGLQVSNSKSIAVVERVAATAPLGPVVTETQLKKRLDTSEQIVSTTRNYTCLCQRKNQTKRASAGTRWVSLDREERTVTTHQAGCVYYSLETLRKEESYTLTINAREFWNRLSTSVAISINRPNSRFNQWSLSPQIRTFNLIELEKSPAIRLFDLADELEDVEWDDASMEKRARAYWHRSIIKVFQTGKASPFDVDCHSNRPILHYMPFSSHRNSTPYVQLIWDTLYQLNFSEHMMLCNGLKPWAWYFSKSLPLDGTKLEPELLPWNLERWLEPDEIPEALLEGKAPADGKLARSFVLAIIMHDRRALLESSNVGPLCQAIIMRSSSKAIELLDDNVSSWDEPFLGRESTICAIDLAIMWFPELINTFLQGKTTDDTRINRQRLPRPHPSRHSFLEVAINFGLRHGERFGKANRDDYLAMIHFALEEDYPVYFHRISLHLGDAEDAVLVHLVERRRRLLDLAQRRLHQSKEQTPCIFEGALVDENVERIIQSFAKEGIAIPEALHPRNLQDPTPLGGSIFEYAWHSEDLCDRLHELGFDPEGFVRSRCRAGPFPMVPLLSPRRWDSWKFLWLEHVVRVSKTGIGQLAISGEEHSGQDLLKTCRLDAQLAQQQQGPMAGPPFVHTLMAFVGHCIPAKFASGFVLPSDAISPPVKPHLQSEYHDKCDCACSISGCTPLNVFIKPVLLGWSPEASLPRYLERVKYLIQVVQVIYGDEKLSTGAFMEMLRYCTFECLGCRHTCCKEPMDRYVYGWLPT
ncbi:hypothetical protein NLU13_8817 [Sarocladium strictum]|uniref:Fungal N-terminal domain-containing protein n=1 Tax=Sarocladium strictum TaxID=5046 RepID=A0AA39G9G2_SARSR|nr:hypothetical protein NLU13_8817 [Sarocladium strictum]